MSIRCFLTLDVKLWVELCKAGCLTATVNAAVSLLGRVLCPSMGLGTESHPPALGTPVTRFAECMGRSHWCYYSAPWWTRGLIWVFWGQTLPHKWRKRDRGFISMSPNPNTKLTYRGKRAWRIIPLLYFAFSVSSGCWQDKKKKFWSDFLHLPFTVFSRSTERWVIPSPRAGNPAWITAVPCLVLGRAGSCFSTGRGDSKPARVKWL